MKYLLIFFFLIFFGCGTQEQVEALKVNKPYFLKDFPDSAYVASIDSILALEPVKKEGDSAKTNIVLNSFTPPKIVSKNQEKVAPTATKNSKPKRQSEENFAEKFSNALSKWQSDPSNKNLYVEIEIKSGENIQSLLVRHYGRAAMQLPKFYTTSVLQSLNPGVALEHLTQSQKVKIPRL